MKFYKYFILLAFTIMSVGFISQNNYTLSDDHKVTIHGTSNLHDWDETVKTVTGKGEVNWNTDGSFNLNKVHINMIVLSIKSDNSTMDKKTYSALKADKHPEILFSLLAPVKSIQVGSNENTFAAKGKLTIAGVTKSITMKVKVVMPAQGKLSFQSSQIIKMSDYGIDPPTALFGALKTGDEITLSFKTNFILNN